MWRWRWQAFVATKIKKGKDVDFTIFVISYCVAETRLVWCILQKARKCHFITPFDQLQLFTWLPNCVVGEAWRGAAAIGPSRKGRPPQTVGDGEVAVPTCSTGSGSLGLSSMPEKWRRTPAPSWIFITTKLAERFAMHYIWWAIYSGGFIWGTCRVLIWGTCGFFIWGTCGGFIWWTCGVLFNGLLGFYLRDLWGFYLRVVWDLRELLARLLFEELVRF